MASPTEVTINSISAATYPVDVFVCSGCPDTNCVLVDTITSVPVTITIPPPYALDPTFSVSIVDSENCIYCQTFGTTTTTTTTINQICDICEIGFDFYDTNPISEISVGVVTGSCDTTITDYVIDWYGPGIGSTNVAFTSGLGSLYSGDYTYIHPLTGTSAVPVAAGIYTPIIRIITVDGVEYTDANCFSSTFVDVDALTCTNGSPTNYPQYSHKISYSATTNVIPQPVYSTFALDPTKPYFAFRVLGYSVFDTFTITFFGSDYQDPIVIENLSVGLDLTETNFNFSLNPKTAKPFLTPETYLSKVLTLTGFTINNGDYLEIKITPNQTNLNTNYQFYCECLESFDCSLCYDTNNTPPFKIIQSSITQTTPTACDRINMTFQVSSCTDSDFYQYMLTNTRWVDTVYEDLFYNENIFTLNNLSSVSQLFCSISAVQYPVSCKIPNTNTITYDKIVSGGIGLINMTFSDFNDMSDYYNDWQTKYSLYSGSPFDCTSLGYLRYFQLQIPLAQGAENCGDNTGYQTFIIHPSSTVTSGGTGPWTLSFTMPTIPDCTSFSQCDFNCENVVNNVITNINIQSTATTNNISVVSNTGSMLEQPIVLWAVTQTGTSAYSAATFGTQMSIPQYINETIPYSGLPLTIIPSLSAKTCGLAMQ